MPEPPIRLVFRLRHPDEALAWFIRHNVQVPGFLTAPPAEPQAEPGAGDEAVRHLARIANHLAGPEPLRRGSNGGMRIAGLIGFLVVNSMCRNPEDRSTLERQRATNSKEILEGQRHLI